MRKLWANPLFTSFSEQYIGTVIHAVPLSEYTDKDPILVLPNGSVDYYETVMFTLRWNKRLCVILEIGGQNCHLLVSSREKNNINIFHLPEARKLLKNGELISITSSGLII